MAPIDRVLTRLHRVKQSGPQSWIASCPTAAHPHGDRSRGLSIRETEDGKVLLNCFAGCGGAEVVAALGLALSDLYPDLPEGRHSHRPKASPIPWGDIFAGIQLDLLTAHTAFAELAAGRTFTPEEAACLADRCLDLWQQIQRARAV